MKIRIEADSQEEFDGKRCALVKALSPRIKSRYDQERPMREPRDPHFRAQAEILKRYNTAFDAMIEEIKSEVGAVLGET